MRLVASTDSHDCRDIGVYASVRRIADCGFSGAMSQLLDGLKWLLVAFVVIGAVPLLVANYQFLLVALHFRRLHYAKCEPWFPRTAILIPAWNEHAVIGASIDRLMRLEYPPESLRIYVVDDASTDATPQVIQAKAAAVPGERVPPAPGEGRRGQGRDAQPWPRASSWPTTGCRPS